MTKVDLHLHTTASDGRLSPQDIVREASGQGLEVIAITDHDTMAGIEPALLAAEAIPNLRVIPGLEINTDIPGNEVHILGYFIDYHDDKLNHALERLRDSRKERGRKIIARLGEMGIAIDWERVLELAAGGSVGRPHIAQAMLERGHVSTLQEAFAKYIGRQGPAYVERERISPMEATRLVADAGGLPVLAHPASIDALEKLLSELKGVGLVGLEAYYNGYRQKIVERLVRTAEKHGLITSGGSDFHGFYDAGETPLGGVHVPESCATRLIALAEGNYEGTATC